MLQDIAALGPLAPGTGAHLNHAARASIGLAVSVPPAIPRSSWALAHLKHCSRIEEDCVASNDERRDLPACHGRLERRGPPRHPAARAAADASACFRSHADDGIQGGPVQRQRSQVAQIHCEPADAVSALAGLWAEPASTVHRWGADRIHMLHRREVEREYVDHWLDVTAVGAEPAPPTVGTLISHVFLFLKVTKQCL